MNKIANWLDEWGDVIAYALFMLFLIGVGLGSLILLWQLVL